MKFNKLLAEMNKSGRGQWGRISDIDFLSRPYLYSLIHSGQIVSVLLQTGKSNKGCRLIDMHSLSRYLETLEKEQKEKPKCYTAHIENAKAGRKKQAGTAEAKA
jgi:hypothetical protein